MNTSVRFDKIHVQVKNAVIELDASSVAVNQGFNCLLSSAGVIPTGRSVRKRKHNPIARMLVNGNCLIYRVKGRLNCDLATGVVRMDTPVITYDAIGYEGRRRSNYHHGQKRKKLMAMIEDPKPAGYSLTSARSNFN